MNYSIIIGIVVGLIAAGIVGTIEGKVLDEMNIFVEGWNCSEIPSDAWTVNCNKVKSITSGMFLIIPSIAFFVSIAATTQKLASAFD